MIPHLNIRDTISIISLGNNIILIASVEITKPYRMRSNEDKISFAILKESFNTMVPKNIIYDQADFYTKFNYFIGYLSKNSEKEKHVENTIFQLPSQFWKNKDNPLFLPFFPFFSNCEGYDFFLPISSITEQSENCTLKSKDQTEEIDPINFIKKVRGDSCSNIEMMCKFDEDLSAESSSDPRWYEMDTQKILFQMTKEPIRVSDISKSYGDSDLVKVKIISRPQNKRIPKQVKLELGYFQVTNIYKRMIKGTISMDNWVKIPANSVNETYKLIIEYKPLSYAELLIEFAFKWNIYLLMYLAIGTISVIIILIFTTFHFVANRDKPRPKIKFWCYIKLVYYAIASGFFLVAIPFCIFLLIISILVRGKIWDHKVIYFNESCTTCPHSIMDFAKITSGDLSKVRNGRIGQIFIVIGYVMMIYSSQLLIFEDKSKKRTKKKEFFDGNIFSGIMWKRATAIFFSTFSILLSIIIINFSFSDYFSANLYILLITIKIVNVIVENMGEAYIENKIFVNHTSMFLNVVFNIITMGANDFLDFLSSYLIELGIMMFERAYFVQIEETSASYLEEKIRRLIVFSKNFFKGDEESEGENDNFESKKALRDIDYAEEKKSEKTENSDTDILLSEIANDSPESSNSCFNTNNLAINSNTPGNNDSLSSISDDSLENKLKSVMLNKSKVNEIKESAPRKKNLRLQSITIDFYCSLSNDSLGLLLFPISLTIIWAFIEETNIAEDYSIEKDSYIYYFLWSVIVIPFQIVIDIMFYTLYENYHKLDLFSYLTKCKYKWENRINSWKAYDNDIDNNLRTLFRQLDQMCYCPQYYFTNSFYVIGMFMVMIGLRTALHNKYNFLSDPYFPILAIFFALFTYFSIELLCFLGKKLKIWIVHKRGSVFPIESESSEIRESQLLNSNDSYLPLQNLNTLKSIRIDNLDKANKMREEEEYYKFIKNMLENEKYQTESFKINFLKVNKKWFNENLKQVFTPTTLKARGNDIIQSFTQIYGEIENEADLKSESSDSNPSPTQDLQDEKIKAPKISPAIIGIMKIWVQRALTNKFTRTYAGIQMEKMCNRFCEFCDRRWGLRSESIYNIEDIFKKFLIENNGISSHWDIIKFQDYFKTRTKIRTICLICSEEIWERHKKGKKIVKTHYARVMGEISRKKTVEIQDINSKAITSQILRFVLFKIRKMKEDHSYNLPFKVLGRKSMLSNMRNSIKIDNL